MKRLLVFGLIVFVSVGIGFAAPQPYAGQVVAAVIQRTPEWDVIDANLPDFEKATGIHVDIRYFEEIERRAKSKIDASTGAGAYCVYYVDEANVAEFAKAGWILPIDKYYPGKYDFKDFLQSMRNVGTVDGVAYFAPVFGGGDTLFYRKDILAKKGIAVPKTLDELLAAAKACYDPPTMYGTSVRGLRGSGSNVWRWITFFNAFGGQWCDKDGNPTFNSPAAVKATQFILQEFKYAPPGATTSTFADDVEAFRSGKVALLVESNVNYSWMMDKSKSQVVDKVGFAPIPAPLPAGSFGHGLAISAAGAKTEAQKKAAAEFIGWATSKEIEMQKLAKYHLPVYRQSSMKSSLMQSVFPKDFLEAEAYSNKVAKITFWRIPEWPEIGDNLGVVLEQLYTGQRTDIQAALDEAVEFAKQALRK